MAHYGYCIGIINISYHRKPLYVLWFVAKNHYGTCKTRPGAVAACASVNATTSAGASRSWRIARQAKRARSTSTPCGVAQMCVQETGCGTGGRTGMDDSTKGLTSSARFESPIMSRAEPSRAEPSRAEPSRAEPSRAEPSRAEPSRAEPSRAEPSRAEPSRAEPSRAEPSRAEPSRAEPSRAEPSRAEPSRAEPSRAEPSRAEPSRAEPSRAVKSASLARVLLPTTA